jgi:hypothetical protein
MAIGGLLQLAKASHDASRLFGSFLLLASTRKLQAHFNAVTTDLSELELTTFGRLRLVCFGLIGLGKQTFGGASCFSTALVALVVRIGAP